MSNMLEHAKREMKAAGLYDADADYGPGSIAGAVEALVEAHSKFEHSGMSHSMTLAIFNKVVNFEALTPLTDDPEEWNEVTDKDDNGKPLHQSRRQSDAFSHDCGKTYYKLHDGREDDPDRPGYMRPKIWYTSVPRKK